jgi:hypothetical protein
MASSSKAATGGAARPTSADFDIAQMNRWLQHLHDRSRELHGNRAVYIHPRLISYRDAGMKANWASDGAAHAYFEGAGDRDTFDNFFKAKTGEAKMSVALCATWAESWVGKREERIRSEPWHCWAFLLVSRPQGYGKKMLIWDCDAEEPEHDRPGLTFHAKDLRLGTQRNAVQAAKKNGVNLAGVWCSNGGGRGANEFRCVDITTAWLEQFADEGSDGVEELGEDDRLAGAVRIGTNT